MNQHKPSLITTTTVLGLSLGLAAFTGCANTGARVVDTGSSQTITSVGHIDDQDWAAAANKLTNNMLTHENLFTHKADGNPKILGISRIINNTAEIVDTDLLIKKIRIRLSESGKVQVTTIGGLTTEDPLAKKDTERSDFGTGDGTPVNRDPDLTLTSKIIETRTAAGDVRQSTFTFQMTLTNAKNGVAVWEGETPITKIGEHNSVGM